MFHGLSNAAPEAGPTRGDPAERKVLFGLDANFRILERTVEGTCPSSRVEIAYIEISRVIFSTWYLR